MCDFAIYFIYLRFYLDNRYMLLYNTYAVLIKWEHSEMKNSVIISLGTTTEDAV